MNLKEIIKQSGIKKEHIINHTGINRTKFYRGIKGSEDFTDKELKLIAKVIGVRFKDLVS